MFQISAFYFTAKALGSFLLCRLCYVFSLNRENDLSKAVLGGGEAWLGLPCFRLRFWCGLAWLALVWPGFCQWLLSLGFWLGLVWPGFGSLAWLGVAGLGLAWWKRHRDTDSD